MGGWVCGWVTQFLEVLLFTPSFPAYFFVSTQNKIESHEQNHEPTVYYFSFKIRHKPAATLAAFFQLAVEHSGVEPVV